MMSTYTNYTVKVRENLSRIRNPGNADDGLSPERIIFSNNENVYYGVFAGQLSAGETAFNNCTINGGLINNAVLNDVTLCCGIDIVELSDLTSMISETERQLSSFDEQMTNIQNSQNDMSSSINNKLFIDNLSAESLSIIHIGSDEFYEKIKNNEILSNQMYIVSGDHVNAYDQQIKNVAEPTLSGDAATKNYVDQISASLQAKVNDLTQKIHNSLSNINESPLNQINENSMLPDVISAVIQIKDILSSMTMSLNN